MIPSIVFFSPWLGVLAFFVGCVGIWVLLGIKKKSLHFAFLDDVQAVYGKGVLYQRWVVLFLLLLNMILSVCIADPRMKNTTHQSIKNGIDIVLVLDLSLSMTATDISPNRLDVAKSVLVNFVDKLSSDRVGFVVFSGKPFVGFPLTYDYDFVKKYINTLSIDTINQNQPILQGTAIGDALMYGANIFDRAERKKVMVLLTDGEANRGIDPNQAILYVKEKNILVHTVGIAGDKDTFVVFGGQKLMIGGVDEKNLKAIANVTSGKYYRAKDKKTFEELFANLNLLEKKALQSDDVVRYQPSYFSLILLFFVLSALGTGGFYYFYLKT